MTESRLADRRKEPPRPFSKRGVELAVFHGPQTQSWRSRYFVPASICFQRHATSVFDASSAIVLTTSEKEAS